MDQEQQSFMLLYEEHKQPIFTYLYRLSGDREMAEELLQECFLKVYLHLDSFRGEASVKTWLYKIARNTYLSAVRKKRPLDKSNSLDGYEPVTLAWEDNPEQVAMNNELRHDVVKTLGYLPENYRTIIILREMNGLSYHEIGNVLQLTIDQVKVTLHRAKKRFKQLHQRDEGGEC